MSKITYNDVYRIWKSEIGSDDLRNLEDIQLGDISSYLSEVRLSLAHTEAENHLQASLLTQEIQNLEFMIRDLLKIRCRKIISAALSQEKPQGLMTISEEDLFNQVLRSIKTHAHFIENTIAGTISDEEPEKTLSETKSEHSSHDDEIKYVTVRFLKDVPATVGIDGSTLGPFKAEDIALVPALNARNMINDRVAVRVVSN
ncbi:MAG: hypothetical protein BAJATHORv1_20511 [Candidatus Thorarchaeota archaeon]|nr:MAG: hypothetical protein BAJATHORv1_20511 [Candidatus Thorarchaeota archaeon]